MKQRMAGTLSGGRCRCQCSRGQAMIPELGHLLLIMALAVSLVQGTLPLVGAHKGRADWMGLARPLTTLQGLLVLAAFVCLTLSFVRHDFSVVLCRRQQQLGAAAGLPQGRRGVGRP